MPRFNSISSQAKERILKQIEEVAQNAHTPNWIALVSSRNGFIQVQEVLPPMTHDPKKRKT